MSRSETQEHTLMAIAERLEEIYRLLGGRDDEVCSQCHHDLFEHTEKGCFHFVGENDGPEYCICEKPC